MTLKQEGNAPIDLWQHVVFFCQKQKFKLEQPVPLFQPENRHHKVIFPKLNQLPIMTLNMDFHGTTTILQSIDLIASPQVKNYLQGALSPS